MKMKTLVTAGFGLILGLSLLAGCGGGGSAIVGPPPHSPPPSNALRVDPHPMPQGWVGQLFSEDENGRVLGGVGARSFRLKSGTLPAGLTLRSDAPGVLFGIPTAAYASTVVITVTDSGNPPSSVNLSLSITINPMLPLTIPPGGALPDGTVGAPYNIACTGIPPFRRCRTNSIGEVLGGMQPYEFSWAASSLPPGLSFGAFGTSCGGESLCYADYITGTPTTAGTFNFLVTVIDSESPPKQASANYTITVAPAPSPSPSPSP